MVSKEEKDRIDDELLQEALEDWDPNNWLQIFGHKNDEKSGDCSAEREELSQEEIKGRLFMNVLDDIDFIDPYPHNRESEFIEAQVEDGPLIRTDEEQYTIPPPNQELTSMEREGIKIKLRHNNLHSKA